MASRTQGCPRKRSARWLQVLVVRRFVVVRGAVLSRTHGAEQLGVRAFELIPRGQRRLFLERAEIVDEQLAVQMVDLVLQASREELGGLDLERLAVPIERAHDDMRGSLDLPVNLGDRRSE